jgi:hypothetical protein
MFGEPGGVSYVCTERPGGSSALEIVIPNEAKESVGALAKQKDDGPKCCQKTTEW